MEIIVGTISPLKENPKEQQYASSRPVEARILNVRPPRKGIAGPSGMERRGKGVSDPLRGRVLTIMVPDSEVLPKDIDTANYKVVMRFQKM